MQTVSVCLHYYLFPQDNNVQDFASRSHPPTRNPTPLTDQYTTFVNNILLPVFPLQYQ